ncbi:hypothetical protein [Streptomyces sp. HUAS ZL42]|uniref:hypothetical protein n=1 Tax=Streptomyces sp. HUAS ZL42 TaxID=3231715 RepID=UPI00345F0871
MAFTLLAAVATLVLPAAGRANALARQSQTMYTPPSNAPASGSLYPCGLRLEHSGSSNGTLLATFEEYTSGTPVFPIYRSTDNGNSWTKISDVADTQNGWGMRWEPQRQFRQGPPAARALNAYRAAGGLGGRAKPSRCTMI